MASLRKDLGLFSLIMITVGSAIGSGIFLTPGKVASYLPDAGLILMAWGIGGLLALLGSMTYAELGGMYPQAGGMYNYLRAAYGKKLAFMYGWANLLVINTGSLAALALAFATYLDKLIPLGGAWGIQAAAAGCLLLVTAMNLFSVRTGSLLVNSITLLKLLGLALVVGVGLFYVHNPDCGCASTSGPDSGNLGQMLGLAMAGVLWSYGGGQHASYLAGEARNAQRTIPQAMVLGTLVVIICYLLMNQAYLSMLTPQEMATSDAVAADALSRWLGPWGGQLVAGIIMLSVLGTAYVFTLTAPRIYYRMAEEKTFFPFLGKLNPRTDTPVNAILLQSAWALCLLLFWGTFSNTITYVLITDWLFFGLAALAVIVLRIRQPEAPRPVRVWGYPFIPGLYVLGAFSFVVFTFGQNYLQAVATAAVLGAGLLMYVLFARRGK
ncbi:MAG: amino acid permease [Bacteroidetes bacterium]|nr:amino acid permease [Bacteroidota bacterium]